MGRRFPQVDDMRNNSLSYTQEARNDELGMLRHSCIADNDFDAQDERRDIQREKSLEYSIDEAYAAYEEMDR